ncbi:MAG: hypothetical protein SGBAC_007146 [Bacillariaceae sp.]
MDSSFVDVTGNHSSKAASSNGSHMSQEDEWLDIDVVTSSTSTEERLRNEVKALQRSLDEKNMELLETNVQVDVLKGHKILLENAKSDLQEELSGQAKQISKLQEDLGSSNAEVMELEEKLSASESLLQLTKTELQSYQVRSTEMELEIQNLQQIRKEESRLASLKLHDATKHAEELKAILSAKEEGIVSRDASLMKLQEDIKSSKNQQATLQTTLVTFQQEKDQLRNQASRLTVDARSIALVAENLRVEKQTLERKLNYSQGKLEQSQNRVQVMEEENKQRQQHQKQQQEQEIQNLSDILSFKTRELEDCKGAVTQLAGEVMTTRAEADHANEALEELKEKHEQFVVEQKHVQEEFLEREEILRLELAQFKSTNEERLEELRQILGVRFRDILVKSKGRSAGTPSSTAKSAPKKSSSVGSYIPPVPILRTVMGLV